MTMMLREATSVSLASLVINIQVLLNPDGVYAVGGVMGVMYIARELFMQDAGEGDDSQACPTCRGTGEVECMCTRWSDGDVGCSSCNYSGRMVCNSCRGGGTGVPITQDLYVRADDRRPPPPPN
ncbi:hypothetical protein CYMTET_7606 [Cymbomonas tetramitiformis]|uniref:Uncharacterized protein n=1 Tax=Cymbomonas tetramitiformis TaxID=36881 RepID=A0AAE0GV50_9CHLO|nr:hypothetical protein CYMTET_7606 [Cymbomonas tetramitiformis]